MNLYGEKKYIKMNSLMDKDFSYVDVRKFFYRKYFHFTTIFRDYKIAGMDIFR